MKIPVIYQLQADFFFFFFFLETRHTDNNNHVSGATTREFWHSLTWYISRWKRCNKDKHYKPNDQQGGWKMWSKVTTTVILWTGLGKKAWLGPCLKARQVSIKEWMSEAQYVATARYCLRTRPRKNVARPSFEGKTAQPWSKRKLGHQHGQVETVKPRFPISGQATWRCDLAVLFIPFFTNKLGRVIFSWMEFPTNEIWIISSMSIGFMRRLP